MMHMLRYCERQPVVESGKLNEVINTFVRQVEVAAGGRDQRGIEAEPPARPNGRAFFQDAFNTAQNQLACRAHAGTDGIGIHQLDRGTGDLNKSTPPIHPLKLRRT